MTPPFQTRLLSGLSRLLERAQRSVWPILVRTHLVTLDSTLGGPKNLLLFPRSGSPLVIPKGRPFAPAGPVAENAGQVHFLRARLFEFLSVWAPCFQVSQFFLRLRSALFFSFSNILDVTASFSTPPVFPVLLPLSRETVPFASSPQFRHEWHVWFFFYVFVYSYFFSSYLKIFRRCVLSNPGGPAWAALIVVIVFLLLFERIFFLYLGFPSRAVKRPLHFRFFFCFTCIASVDPSGLLGSVLVVYASFLLIFPSDLPQDLALWGLVRYTVSFFFLFPFAKNKTTPPPFPPPNLFGLF